jgi:hypothetical protein
LLEGMVEPMIEFLQNYTYKSEVPPEHFAHMTDWHLSWCKREPAVTFSLVLIDFKDPATLGNALGAKYAMDLLRRIGNEIHSTLRTTDLLCRTRVSCFWVLLPNGEPDIVLTKLAPILAAAKEEGLDATKLHVGTLSISQDISSDVTAAELFLRLKTVGSLH